ncbi:DinB family protein [Chitinophaga sp. Cy-1792]|uniref:DinB family protein n=1 Tax=Chitinophaga sp. Cy-1792 TaxID=2608339 RepID=UPI0014203AEC|nr:DinB family protein [Chitinophaga sp. Cy-1792]NIG55159.1 DinB family protein [Chitinophaga sp. Cy-1792]
MENTTFLDLTLNAWDSQVKRLTAAFDSFSDEELELQVAPNRNRVIYILGHMIAVNDMMLALLGLAERKYAQLDEFFISNPDEAIDEIPEAKDLRAYWKDITTTASQLFRALPPDEWLQKHTMVTQEEFEKEPNRNRYNVLLSRLNHMSYHLGQVVLVNR